MVHDGSHGFSQPFNLSLSHSGDASGTFRPQTAARGGHALFKRGGGNGRCLDRWQQRWHPSGPKPSAQPSN